MTSDKEHIIRLSDLLDEASSGVRILRNIAWSNEVKAEFFRTKAEKLPKVEYKPFDPSEVLDKIKFIRSLIGDSDPVDQWAFRIAESIKNSALMVSSRGTADFFNYSKKLYGEPSQSMPGDNGSALALAKHFDHMFDHVSDLDLGEPAESCVLASALASDMTSAVKEMFGDLAPEVVMDPEMPSKAIAGRRRIRIRPSACFTDKDINQLIEHEAAIHVGTSLNGKLQPHLKILSESHAGTTKTQEGIAVFAEYITGYIDLDRVMRLTDRVISSQMAIDGADFIEIYRYYLERTDTPEAAFDCAKRVCRGGVLTGGAPFTKDIVYLDGFIRVHAFLRKCMLEGNVNDLYLLFAGKLDIADIPVLRHFESLGILEKPRFLPNWMQDKRFLLTHLAYSSFLSD
jgi:uncharacterized protein (TIGR02421 family)